MAVSGGRRRECLRLPPPLCPYSSWLRTSRTTRGRGKWVGGLGWLWWDGEEAEEEEEEEGLDGEEGGEWEGGGWVEDRVGEVEGEGLKSQYCPCWARFSTYF